MSGSKRDAEPFFHEADYRFTVFHQAHLESVTAHRRLTDCASHSFQCGFGRWQDGVAGTQIYEVYAARDQRTLPVRNIGQRVRRKFCDAFVVGRHSDGVGDRVAHFTESRNLYFHHVAGGELSDTRRGAGCNHVARLQCHDPRYVG